MKTECPHRGEWLVAVREFRDAVAAGNWDAEETANQNLVAAMRHPEFPANVRQYVQAANCCEDDACAIRLANIALNAMEVMA